DFTFVDDIAKGTVEALKLKSYHVINLGNNSPVELNYVIRLIEKYLNRKAEIRYREFHKADIKATWADIEKATQLLNWKPQIGIEEGIEKTVQWFEENKSLIDNISIG
ncbi:nucleotide sugar epimerase, partial [Thermococci archaeon]